MLVGGRSLTPPGRCQWTSGGEKCQGQALSCAGRIQISVGDDVRRLYSGSQNPHLDPERATERSAAIIRLRTVMIHEDVTEAAITKEGAAEFSNISRCFHPARRFRIEISKFLQLS